MKYFPLDAIGEQTVPQWKDQLETEWHEIRNLQHTLYNVRCFQCWSFPARWLPSPCRKAFYIRPIWLEREDTLGRNWKLPFLLAHFLNRILPNWLASSVPRAKHLFLPMSLFWTPSRQEKSTNNTVSLLSVFSMSCPAFWELTYSRAEAWLFPPFLCGARQSKPWCTYIKRGRAVCRNCWWSAIGNVILQQYSWL